jgi:uncharacterized protein with HEPN domain
MERDDSVYLRHILDAISRIEEYLYGIDEEKFYQHYLVQDGVIRQLEIIGEASKRLSCDVRARYPNVPWQDIAGMRDKLISTQYGSPLVTMFRRSKPKSQRCWRSHRQAVGLQPAS